MVTFPNAESFVLFCLILSATVFFATMEYAAHVKRRMDSKHDEEHAKLLIPSRRS